MQIIEKGMLYWKIKTFDIIDSAEVKIINSDSFHLKSRLSYTLLCTMFLKLDDYSSLKNAFEKSVNDGYLIDISKITREYRPKYLSRANFRKDMIERNLKSIIPLVKKDELCIFKPEFIKQSMIDYIESSNYMNCLETYHLYRDSFGDCKEISKKLLEKATSTSQLDTAHTNCTQDLQLE